MPVQRDALGFCRNAAVCLLAIGCILTQRATARAESGPAPAAVSSATAPAKPAEEEDTKEAMVRRQKVRIAVITGGLIAVTGIALVILTILGGSATRRGLRRKPIVDGAVVPEPLPADRFEDPADDIPAEGSTDDAKRSPQEGDA